MRKEKTMPNFVKALEEGFEAARKADAARNEIDEVFRDLNTQVLKVTNNQVSIERKELPESSFDRIRRLADPDKPTNKLWAIVAFNPTVGKTKEFQLADWEMDRAGYPCKVTWNRREHVCEDKEALINCLSELLKDPVIGQNIYTLTKLEPTKKT
jgi:hypothetical protein